MKALLIGMTLLISYQVQAGGLADIILNNDHINFNADINISVTTPSSKYILKILQRGCESTKTWEGSSKCYKNGTMSMIRGKGLNKIITSMCEHAKEWEGAVKCYRGAIETSRNRHLKSIKKACEAATTWKGTSRCYFAALN